MSLLNIKKSVKIQQTALSRKNRRTMAKLKREDKLLMKRDPRLLVEVNRWMLRRLLKNRGRTVGGTQFHKGKGRRFQKFVGKRFRHRKKLFKPARKTRDLQVQFVFVRGQKMRCITKADGRTIYRAPRVQQVAQGGKTKADVIPKKRKSDKVRLAARHFVRSHNDLEARVLKKRHMYHRHKKLMDYLGGKLDTPASLAYQAHKRGRRFERNLSVLFNRLNPRTNVRTTHARLTTGSMADLKVRPQAERGLLRKRRLVGGIVSFYPGTQVETKSHVMAEQPKRLRKRPAAWKLPKFEGNRLEMLLGNRKANAIAEKSPNHPLYDERLSSGGHRNGKHR